MNEIQFQKNSVKCMLCWVYFLGSPRSPFTPEGYTAINGRNGKNLDTGTFIRVDPRERKNTPKS